MDNAELMKGVITAAGDLASAGKLQPEEANQFIDYVVDETVLKGNARVIRMNAETRYINKIGVGRRVSVPAVEATDPGVRFNVQTSRIELTPKEIMTPFAISDLAGEISVEGQGSPEAFRQKVVQMMGKQCANDYESLYANGDTKGVAAIEGDIKPGGSATKYVKDALMALFDGWWRLGDSGHVVDAENGNIGASVFSTMLRAMPTKFLRNTKDLRWFMSPYMAQLWRERVSTRATAAGDAALSGQDSVRPFGIQIVEVPLVGLEPTTVEHVALPGTTQVQLRYSPISDVIVHPASLAAVAADPYTEGVDYEVNTTTGKINRKAGGAIGDGDTVKVTYNAQPQILLTHAANFIVGIGRDVRIERDRDIYARTDLYAITSRVAVQIEETDALVKAVNIGLGV